jgi:CBS domain-containing protein
MPNKVRDVMTKNPIALEADQPVTVAARRMREAEVGDVLVTRDGDLCGIVTDRDIVVRCVASGGDPETTALGRICSEAVATLRPDDDADRAVALMKQHAVRRIPVVDDGRLVGIVSLGDLAVERDRSSALGSISAAPANN